MDSSMDIEKLPLYQHTDLNDHLQAEARTYHQSPNTIRTIDSSRVGSFRVRNSIRDVAFGFVLATACWTAPKVAEITWPSVQQYVNSFIGQGTMSHQNPFPSGEEIGFEGPTRTGSEPFAAVTAAASPRLQSYFPIVSPARPETIDSFDPVRSWGYLSPFESLPHGTFGLPSSSSKVPEKCELKQVHLLHRHGARYPTGSKEPAGFSKRLKAAKGLKASGNLTFLNGWKNSLGIEILTPFGRNQLFNLGVGFRQKYGHLLDQVANSTKLVFRTTSQHRMLYSALNFAAGFFGLPFESQYHQSILIEAESYNNSLAPYFTCHNSKEASKTYAANIMTNWSKIYLVDALPRLQASIEGYQLTFEDLVSMQQLCAYETISLGWSSFCNLFTSQEFKGFAYYSDLAFWYAYSFGSPYAAALGKGWVQELVSRLSKTPIQQYDSSTNYTLNSNPETFPLNQPIYVDATHDTVISCIIVALNLTTLAAEGPLPTTHIPGKQSFVSSHISPFAANLQTQIVECDGEEKIRFVLNDAPVPLTGLRGCPEDEHGFCPLNIAIESLTARINEIDYAHDCNFDHKYVPPVGGGGIVDGRPPRQVY